MATKRLIPEIIIDSREQRPFSFSWVTPIPPITKVGTLKTGDYSIVGLTDKITIERKSRADLEGCCVNRQPQYSRKRFERELERLAAFHFAVVVIEADYQTFLSIPSEYSRLKPKSLIGSLTAWKQRYGVHFELCPSREFAQKITYRHLERFFIDVAEGKRQV